MFKERFNELAKVIQNCSYTSEKNELTEEEAMHSFHSLIHQTKEAEGTIYVIGNGGSSGIASHFCIDLLNVIKVGALTLYDSNVMTCISNDYGYDQVFSLPLTTLLKKNDLLVAISSSGQSSNILKAAEVAKEKETRVITLSGFKPLNPLRALGDLNFYLEISDYGLVEMGHFFLLHTIIDSWHVTLNQKEQIFSLAHA